MFPLKKTLWLPKLVLHSSENTMKRIKCLKIFDVFITDAYGFTSDIAAPNQHCQSIDTFVKLFYRFIGVYVIWCD